MINIITFLATSLSQNDKGHKKARRKLDAILEKRKKEKHMEDPGSRIFVPLAFFTCDRVYFARSLVEVLHISPMEESIGGDGDNLTTPP